MKRILSMAGAFALGLSLLTACGDSGVPGVGGGDDYCENLKAAKDKLDGAESGDLGSLDEAADLMKDLADSAPDEIKDDWEVLQEGFQEILDAFDEAGIDQDDLEAMQNGDMPPDLDMEAFQQAMAELESLDSEEFQKASDNISKHAKEECDIDLDA